MLPADINPASLLYGFAAHARTFPWTLARDEIWQAFEDYGHAMWPNLSRLDRAHKVRLRWDRIMKEVSR